MALIKIKLTVAFRNFANASKCSALWTTRLGVLRLTVLVILAADLRECVPGRTVTTDSRRFPRRPSKATLYTLQSVHIHHYQNSTHVWVSRGNLDVC
jgi:hypothetical protein